MANLTAELDALVGLVDWVETYNARVVFGEGNERAATFALRTGLPGSPSPMLIRCSRSGWRRPA